MFYAFLQDTKNDYPESNKPFLIGSCLVHRSSLSEGKSV